MPEMRQDAVTGHWVIIATERAKRPEIPKVEKKSDNSPRHNKECFFCWGNENTTPPEVYSIRLDGSDPDTTGWLLRVVENKFAAVNLLQPFNIEQVSPLYSHSYAAGKAEVIIETHHHSKAQSQQSLIELKRVLKSYVDRYQALLEEPELKYILIFRNCGAIAGASLEHPHSQIIAIPIVPPDVAVEIEASEMYYKKNKSCIYCDILDEELNDKSRIIYENDHFVSLAPYASRTPFETMIIPKFHSARFETIDSRQLNSLSSMFKAVFYKLDAGLANPPYNYFIHTSPTQQNVDQHYHWHIEIIPKLTVAAGFELGTGMFINITIPEECAEFLRNIEVEF
ncbi:MAG: galactose-1-phosphate uridylyltransferase [Vampirovibrionia bacterium]